MKFKPYAFTNNEEQTDQFLQDVYIVARPVSKHARSWVRSNLHGSSCD